MNNKVYLNLELEYYLHYLSFMKIKIINLFDKDLIEIDTSNRVFQYLLSGRNQKINLMIYPTHYFINLSGIS